jgi:hypothetical protein
MKKYSILLNLVAVVILLSMAGLSNAAPPKVIKMIPKNGQQDVDPALKQISIEFDQDMNIAGFSICGGGPSLPELGKPRWLNKRTLVADVKLKPNYEYQMSINCPSYQNCKSVNGESAEIYPVNFKTASAAPQEPNKVDNKIKILSISPDINTPLKVGNSYEIAVQVEYSLKQDNGVIALAVQIGDVKPDVSSTLGNVTEPITKGNGKLTLKAKIIVPNTNSIQVFTPLSVPGESQTKIVDMRVFKVVENK